jgi:DNA-binding FadR family transcriptional regulator
MLQSPFRTIGSKERLVDRVVDELEQLIVTGQLEPETRLPAERDLADQLGVSRTVIREASRILVTKGLLEIRPGVGTLVRQITNEQIVEPLNLLLRSRSGGEVSFDHLHQVRSILEIEIAGLAAAHATNEDIARLKQIMAAMEAAQDDPDQLAIHDADFHSAIAQITHNPLLAILVDSIRDLLQEYIALVTRYLDPRQENLPLHYRLLERIEARDVEGARQAMDENLDQMRKNTERYSKLSQMSDNK